MDLEKTFGDLLGGTKVAVYRCLFFYLPTDFGFVSV